ncbi:TPA: malonyl-ACP O-methyltransferase BioC [Providencia rettgeri]|uniref:malonyl-ACP O-methyltransferase BioC n=1 Tax=Providencia sp. PROV129 TaxID=2949839 RepID=UPI00234A9612|nr:malonyl-ACP O-methyltransferase BioC [Providencia sp. PROV129]HEC8330403.1 malonyl-ACP O-methyltransferase BioC [Providencia rettgeri]
MTSIICHDKQKIAAAFGRAATRYDAIANYQQTAGEQLLNKLKSTLFATQVNMPLRVLDAGCGTGFFSQKLKHQGHTVTALDLSSGMLDVAKSKNAADEYLCADIESIPTHSAQFDVVFSNLSIQWCENLHGALSELYRVTKRGGVIVFTTLAEHSLNELSKAWQLLDEYSHVNTFLSPQAITSSCQTWRHELSFQKDTLYFPDLISLLNSLKGIGATYLTEGRQTGLMTRKRLQQLALAYPMAHQGLPLTYQTVFGVIYRD